MDGDRGSLCKCDVDGVICLGMSASLVVPSV